MKKINYFKILADKTIKVIGFHGLNRFFYAYVSYDGKKILISNIQFLFQSFYCILLHNLHSLLQLKDNPHNPY